MEKGELDDNGDLKKEINERLLTARQVSEFILHSLVEYILRTSYVPRMLLGNGNISGEKKEVSVLMELLFLCVCVLEGEE